MEEVVERVLLSMSSVKQPQKKFIASLFSVLIAPAGIDCIAAIDASFMRKSGMHTEGCSRVISQLPSEDTILRSVFSQSCKFLTIIFLRPSFFG